MSKVTLETVSNFFFKVGFSGFNFLIKTVNEEGRIYFCWVFLLVHHMQFLKNFIKLFKEMKDLIYYFRADNVNFINYIFLQNFTFVPHPSSLYF